MSCNIKYQLIKYTVGEAATVSIDAATDRLYKRCTGIHVTVSVNDSTVYGSTLQLKINNKEIFPEGFEIKMITTGTDVAPDDRFYTLEEPAEGGKVEGTYKDNNASGAYPYTLLIYLRLEKE